ncbi:NAD(P)-dependent dehydrogenase (short-subunit alcohol dehydrogenase family) [Phenylobacterium haematophilum]|uniref:NAD(P)-dependent dehydrogenase (Short-subunit alcohol dehydrogenase family) n=1 Tax=Phenylobacterium haematophilum TaxID=98513 RepID=A0A840A1N1_9CAUL|nr:NAD(P)-dependent dehydrogenase (short-subunit alcohol dehydrogenase family) [Phenylobacterium haematophilum]
MSAVSQGDIAVVVGASGGIGRALVAALCDDARYEHVVGLSRRRPSDFADDGRRSWIQADILDAPSLLEAARQVKALGSPTRVIVATGALHGPGLAPEKSLRALNLEALDRAFQVNVIGPALVAQQFLCLAPKDSISVFAALSARVGSIADNATGGWYGYRASKAALNMVIRTAAIEHARSHPLGVCVAIHPGTVSTALSRPFLQKSTRTVFTPQVAADHILRVVDGLSPLSSGGFYAWDGTTIPW